MTDLPFCSLDPDGLAVRKAAWADLDGAVVARRPTATGAEVVYGLEPGVAERILALVEAEAVCCPDLTWEATVTVAIHAPEEERGRVIALAGAGNVAVWEGAVLD